MPTVINCPSCESPLHIPADLHGRPLRCPACGQVFMLPPQPEPMATPAEKKEGPSAESEPARDNEEILDAEVVEEGDEGQKRLDYEAARQRVFVGAFGLAAFGTLGLFLGLLEVSNLLRGNRPELPDMTDMPPAWKDAFQQLAAGPFFLIWSATSAAISFVILLCARQMFFLRYWRLGVLASILAIVNGLFDCWCLFGIVIAVYSLRVLYDPDVRVWFE